MIPLTYGLRGTRLSFMSSYVAQRVMARAARRGGIVTIDDVRSLEVEDKVMSRLVSSGVFRRAFPGVFVLAGLPADHRVALRAALMAVGKTAVVSHRSAAWLYGMVDQPPAEPHITVATTAHLAAKGMVVHRGQAAIPSRRVQGILCTDPVRTLVDLAGQGGPGGDLGDALDRALAGGHISLTALEGALPRRRRGVAKLQACLAERGYIGGPAPSVFESRMARLLTGAGFAGFSAEVIAGPDGRYRIDFADRVVRLALECYGFAWHRSPAELARDERRHRTLTLEGWTVLIYTWHDLDYPERVVAEIHEAYRRCAALESGRRAG